MVICIYLHNNYDWLHYYVRIIPIPISTPNTNYFSDCSNQTCRQMKMTTNEYGGLIIFQQAATQNVLMPARIFLRSVCGLQTPKTPFMKFSCCCAAYSSFKRAISNYRRMMFYRTRWNWNVAMFGTVWFKSGVGDLSWCATETNRAVATLTLQNFRPVWPRPSRRRHRLLSRKIWLTSTKQKKCAGLADLNNKNVCDRELDMPTAGN